MRADDVPMLRGFHQRYADRVYQKSRSTGTIHLTRSLRHCQPSSWGLQLRLERTRIRLSALCVLALSTVLPIASRAAECVPDCPCTAPRLLEVQDLAVAVDPATLQKQYDALRAMRLDDIKYSPLGPVQVVSGDTGVVLPAEVVDLKEGDSAAGILVLFTDLLLANGNEALTVTRHDVQYATTRQLRFSESIHGIPVINGGVGLAYDERTKRVSSFAANFIPDRGLPRTPRISAAQAERLVPGEVTERAYLGYYVRCCGRRRPNLVWAIGAWTEKMGEMFYVDAITGVIVDHVQTTTIG